jgi:hypothetical protein
MRERRLSFLFEWRRAVVSEDNGLGRADKHVALTMSLHMDGDGGSCRPGYALLAKETSGSRRWVIETVARLVRSGWLEVSSKGGPRRGKAGGGLATEYRASFPMWWLRRVTTSPEGVVHGGAGGSYVRAPQDVMEGVKRKRGGYAALPPPIRIVEWCPAHGETTHLDDHANPPLCLACQEEVAQRDGRLEANVSAEGVK